MENRGWIAEFKAQACAVQQNQSPDALRLLQRNLHRDPTAHGPPSQIDLLQMLAIQKSFDHPCLFGDGVAGIPGLRGVSVTQQIDGVHPVAAIDKLRNQVGPVLAAAAKPVHQHEGPAGATHQVMHFVAIHGDKLAVDTVHPEPCGDLLVEQPKRIAPGQNAKTQSQ